MRILVTGGAGYIGSHAVRLFLARGHDVWVYDNLSMGHRAAVPADRLVVGDLSEQQRLDHLLVMRRIEAVVHFAAFAFVGESVTNPAKYYQNNLVNTLNLLEALRRHKIGRFVFSSTCATYGVPEKVPITEDEKQRPINPYGNTKLAVEHALADYARRLRLGLRRPALLQRRRRRPGRQHRRGSRSGNAPDPASSCKRCWASGRTSRSSARTTRRRTAPASATTSTSTTWPRPTCWRWRALGPGKAAALQPRHRPRLQRPRGDPRRRGGDGQEGAGEGGAAPAPATRRRWWPAADKVQRELGWKPHYTDIESIIETAWNWHRTHPKGYDDRK